MAGAEGEVAAAPTEIVEETKSNPDSQPQVVRARELPFGMPHVTVNGGLAHPNPTLQSSLQPRETCLISDHADDADAGDEAESVEAVVGTVKLLFQAFSNRCVGEELSSWATAAPHPTASGRTFFWQHTQCSVPDPKKLNQPVSLYRVLRSDSSMFSGLVDPDARFVRTCYDEEGTPDVRPRQPPRMLTHHPSGHLMAFSLPLSR